MPLPQPQPHDPALSADIRAISDAINALQGQVDAIVTMVGSGASHAGGLVPDTPVSSGITKFLREDGTWAVPGTGTDPPTGTPPTPVLVVAGGTTGYAPHSIVAQGFQTTAGDSPITSYAFDWGDGSAVSQTARTISGTSIPVPISYHEYATAGPRTLRMTVSDANGNSVSTTQTITVNAIPAPDVTVSSGGDLDVALNALGAGGVLQINAGTYTMSNRWTAKDDQIVYANGTVVITGAGSEDEFCTPMNATGVILQGVRITNFLRYAIWFGFSGDSGSSMILKHVEIDTCGTNGVLSGALNGGTSAQIILAYCHFHNNKSYNVDGGDIIIGGEYDHGFMDTSGSIDPKFDGVWKLGRAGDTISYIVGVNSHDNHGVGMWWDSSNVNVYICLNTITDNDFHGIFWEVNDAAAGGEGMNVAGNLDGTGFSCRILFNTLVGNGYPESTNISLGNAYPEGISVHKSDKVEIAYNILDALAGSHGIILDYQVGRAEGHNLANISVHHNDVRLREEGDGGGDADVGRCGFRNSVAGTAYSLTNVTWHDNHYYAAHDSSTWTHFMRYVGTTETPSTFAEWKAAGYDANSTWALATAWPH